MNKLSHGLRLQSLQHTPISARTQAPVGSHKDSELQLEQVRPTLFGALE